MHDLCVLVATVGGMAAGVSVGYRLAFYVQRRRAVAGMRALQQQVSAMFESARASCPCPECTAKRKREAVLQ